MTKIVRDGRVETNRARNLVHTAVLVTGIGLVTLLSAALLWSWPGALFALAVLLLLTIFGPRVAPEAVMRLYRAAPVRHAHGGPLVAIVDALAQRAGLPRAPLLYVIPSPTINAFATGSADRSAIALSHGMLRTLDIRELTAVLAHEMSHIRSNDLFVMGLADVMTRFTLLLSYVAVMLAALNVPAILLGLPTFPWAGIALLYLAPAVASLLQLALSRARELDADLEGATLSGDPAALASALRKIDRLEGRFWEDLMFPPARRIPYPSLLRSHPDTDERVARLAALAETPTRPLLADIEPRSQPTFYGSGIIGNPRRRWTGVWY